MSLFDGSPAQFSVATYPRVMSGWGCKIKPDLAWGEWGKLWLFTSTARLLEDKFRSITLRMPKKMAQAPPGLSTTQFSITFHSLNRFGYMALAFG